MVLLAILPHVYLQALGKRVDHARAYAVQAAGNLVALAAELAARVQDGQAHFHRGSPKLGVDAHGKAAAVVMHLAGAIAVQGDADIAAKASERLVDSPALAVNADKFMSPQMRRMMKAMNKDGADAPVKVNLEINPRSTVIKHLAATRATSPLTTRASPRRRPVYRSWRSSPRAISARTS